LAIFQGSCRRRLKLYMRRYNKMSADHSFAIRMRDMYGRSAMQMVCDISFPEHPLWHFSPRCFRWVFSHFCNICTSCLFIFMWLVDQLLHGCVGVWTVHTLHLLLILSFVLDIPTPEEWKAELILDLILYRDGLPVCYPSINHFIATQLGARTNDLAIASPTS